MQPKHFNTLALTAVISLVAAGVVHSSYNSWTDDTATGKRLFPSLERGGDATSQIVIQQGEDKLTLKKSADGKIWSLVERAGYPVDPTKVRELVVKLGQTELIERKTNKEARYDQLDLGDPTAKDSSAKVVRLFDNNKKTIAELVVGKERRGAFGAGKAGTYIRVPGDPQTWLAKVELNAPTSVDDWVKPKFFEFDQKKMKSLVVMKGDTAIYKLGVKDKKPGEFELVDIPASSKPKKDLRIDDLVNGIRTLEMVDVRAAGVADGKPDMTADIELDDGTKYRVGMKREDKKRWMTVAVLAEGKDAAGAKKLKADSKGWAFEIADWRADQTFKKPEDVFEAVKAAAKPKVSVPPTATKPVTAQPATPATPRATPETTEQKKPEPANAEVPKK